MLLLLSEETAFLLVLKIKKKDKTREIIRNLYSLANELNDHIKFDLIIQWKCENMKYIRVN